MSNTSSIPTAEQRRKDLDRASRVGPSLDSVPMECLPQFRDKTREQLRNIAAEVEHAKAEKVKLQAYLAKLETELAEAEEHHQTVAARIQSQLNVPNLTAEARVELRQQLNDANKEFQAQATELGRKMDATEDEIGDLFIITCRESKLPHAFRRTAEPELQLKMAAAESVLTLLQNTCVQFDKEIAAHEASLQIRAEREAKIREEESWLPERLRPRKEKPLGGEYDEGSPIPLLKAQEKMLSGYTSQQSQLVQKLQREILES